MTKFKTPLRAALIAIVTVLIALASIFCSSSAKASSIDTDYYKAMGAEYWDTYNGTCYGTLDDRWLYKFKKVHGKRGLIYFKSGWVRTQDSARDINDCSGYNHRLRREGSR